MNSVGVQLEKAGLLEPACEGLRILETVLRDAKLLKTLTKQKRQVAKPKAEDLERFVFVGPDGQAELKHIDVQNHEWTVEPSSGPVVRIRLLSVMPHTHSKTQCLTGASSLHRDVAALADAMEGSVHESDSSGHEDLAIRLHALSQRMATGAVRTNLQLAGPASRAKAIGTNAETLSCYELTDVGRDMLLGMAGRHVRIGSTSSSNLFQFSSLGYLADERDFADPVEALRIHMRAENMVDAMLRRTGRRRRR